MYIHCMFSEGNGGVGRTEHEGDAPVAGDLAFGDLADDGVDAFEEGGGGHEIITCTRLVFGLFARQDLKVLD